MFELIGSRTGADGVTDLLFPRHHFEHVARKLAARAPQGDLEGECIATRLTVYDPLKRRIRNEPAVPIMLTLDLDGWEAGRSGGCASIWNLLAFN